MTEFWETYREIAQMMAPLASLLAVVILIRELRRRDQGK